MTHENTEIPRFVADAIEDVERRGLTDMYDRETVLMFAATFGHPEGAEWLATRRHLYFRALVKSRERSLAPVG